MKGGSGTKTSLFLVELIIALLLFAFCAAICIQAFNAARNQTRGSENLSRGVFLATSAAEIYKASGGDVSQIAGRLGGVADATGMTVNFDGGWNETLGDGVYKLTVSANAANLVAAIKVVETSGNKPIYALTVKAVRG
jgi:type II secretory pathway pseudopilin PulG